MKPWMLRVVRTTVTLLRGGCLKPPHRSCRSVPVLDILESREVQSSLGGTPALATVVGQVNRPARPAQVTLRLEPGRFVGDRPIPMLLGLEAHPLPGSPVQPKVTRVVSLNGLATRELRSRSGSLVTNVQVPLSRPTDYRVNVAGLRATTGAFALNAFLPGDVNSDGVVDRTDIARVRRAYDSRPGSRRYDPGADVNHDGRIGHVDYGFTRRNLGARASIVTLSTPITPTRFPYRSR